MTNSSGVTVGKIGVGNGAGLDQIFVRHGIGSFNVVFSGGNPARTGPRCDLTSNPFQFN